MLLFNGLTIIAGGITRMKSSHKKIIFFGVLILAYMIALISIL